MTQVNSDIIMHLFYRVEILILRNIILRKQNPKTNLKYIVRRAFMPSNCTWKRYTCTYTLNVYKHLIYINYQ